MNRRAFTLIEMLTVIVIMAAIIVVALPALRAVQSTALQAAARQVSNALQLGRQYAITQRRPVRLLLAVNTESARNVTERVCRAYSIVIASNDVNGSVAAWIPLEDWRFLPPGIVFSDHNNTSYNTINMPETPPLGTSQRRYYGKAPVLADAWKYFNNDQSMYVITNPISGAGATLTYSVVEFRPTGQARVESGSAGGVRLMQGSVAAARATDCELIITDTNNWVYVEYDAFGGRVRIRYRDSFR